MTTKRRKVVALVLLAVIGGVISYSLLRRSDEPEYKGRRLSEWLEEYWYKPNSTGHADAKTAVRNIGTNALPCLLKWISYERPAWRATLDRKLPTFLQKHETVYRWIEGGGRSHARYAIAGFGILGTNAVSAMPELEALMKDNTKPTTSERVIYVLGDIGAPAIPVLKAALADSNQSNRWQIIDGLSIMSRTHGTNVCLPILLEALTNDDSLVRIRATNALRWVAPEALTNAPPR